MTTPTIRDLCAALSGDVKYLLACIQHGSSDSCALQECLDRVNTARDLLAAEPVGEDYDWEGAIAAVILDHSYVDPERNLSRVLRECDFGATARAILARWGRPAAPPAPDPGEVGELLAALGSKDRWMQLTDAQLDRAATLLQQQQHLLTLAGAELDRLMAQQLSAPAPAAPEVGGVGDAVQWLLHHASDRGEQPDGPCTRAATLLQRLSAPAPVVVPVAGEVAVAIVRFEFEVLDEHDHDLASGEASTLEEAAREGRHYLGQYEQDGPCTLELRRVEVLNLDAIPLPQGGEVEG